MKHTPAPEQLNPETIITLIGEIYDAAVDQARWPGVLENLAHVFSGASATLVSYGECDFEGVIHASHNFDPQEALRYEQYYHRHDILFASAKDKGFMIPGTAVIGDQYIERSEYRRSMLYNEFASRIGIDQILSMILMDEGSASVMPPTCLNFYRRSIDAHFDTESLRLARMLIPHVQRAFLIHWRLVAAEGKVRGGETTLDRLDHGVLQLSAQGQLLYANRAARDVLAAAGPLRIERGYLATRVPGYGNRLNTLLIQAAQGVGGFLGIPEPRGKPAMHILATPLPEDSPMKSRAEVRVLVLLSAAGERSTGSLGLLARGCGLTPAETRVLEMLATDRAPVEIAETLGTGIETVRSQFKSIYAKIGVSGQRQLLTLLARLPAICSGSDAGAV